MMRTHTRRAFLASIGAATLSGCARTARHAAAPRSKSANERLDIALVGCGGRGYENLKELGSENIVALCDVDSNRAARAHADYPNAARYRDWRRLFDRADSFDAVVVSTPDHMHAPISISAMKLDKHVYCEKPLARSIGEAWSMARTAVDRRVATQMGTQGVSFDASRTTIELLRAGAIGTPQAIHVWTDRALNWWPQGVERPYDTPAPPPNLDWDLWLGVAPERPYHPAYHPFRWRGWKDFGSGAIGDMGIHNAAIAFLGLDLGKPGAARIVESSQLFPETFPAWSELRLEFPASSTLPALAMHWYDGGRKPSSELIDGDAVDGNGCIIVGSEGVLYSSDWAGDNYCLYPKAKFADYVPPTPTLPRVAGHHAEWIHACKGGPAAMCNFPDFAAPLTEIMQLGNLALLVGHDIEWDASALQATNAPAAAQFVNPTYRASWQL